MTIIEVRPEPVLEDPTGGGHRVTHWMCCLGKRGDVAFCGTLLEGAGDLAPEVLPDCVVCDEFANAEPDATCPYDGTPCPPES
jgi:hypothetical protein